MSMECYLLPEYDVYVVYRQVQLLGYFLFTCNEVMFCLLSASIMGVTVGTIYRTIRNTIESMELTF